MSESGRAVAVFIGFILCLVVILILTVERYT